MFKEIEKQGHGYLIHKRDEYEAIIYFDPGSTPLNRADLSDICQEIYNGSGGRLLCDVESADYGIISLLVNAIISFYPEIGIDEDDALKIITDKISNLTV